MGVGRGAVSSLGCESKLNSLFALLLCYSAEEGYFLFIGGLPGVITLERALEMCFDVHIECLRL